MLARAMRCATITVARGRAWGLPALLGSLLLGLSIQASASAATPDASSPPAFGTFEFGCGPYRYVDLPKLDYRLKDVTPEGKKGVWDLDHYHTDPAREEMSKAQPHPLTVIGNLDFALRHSPNHHEALSLLIAYKRRGGNLLKFATVDCYLEWAHRFAPDDSIVLGYGAMYFAKTGNRDRAEAWYKAAVELDPKSAETHYNLGLLYFQTKRYELAREQARVAYSLGYPLPGLRDLLAKQGYALGSQ